MMVINAPIAAVRYGPSTARCTNGRASIPARDPQAKERVIAKTTMSTPTEIATDTGAKTAAPPTDDDEHTDRDRHRHRSEDGCSADEGQDAPAAFEVGKDGVGVADHRCAGRHIRDPPHSVIGDQDANAGSDHTFGDIADEDRDRGFPAEGLASVPESWVAVTDRPQIDGGLTLGDKVGDRDGADEVADNNSNNDVDNRRRKRADRVHC